MNNQKDYESQYTAYFLGKIIELVKENYFLNIPNEILYQAAIEGILNSLDDYSVYLIPEKKETVLNNEIQIPVEEYWFCVKI